LDKEEDAVTMIQQIILRILTNLVAIAKTTHSHYQQRIDDMPQHMKQSTNSTTDPETDSPSQKETQHTNHNLISYISNSIIAYTFHHLSRHIILSLLL